MKLSVVLYTEGLPFTGNTLATQSLGGAETAFIYVARELARMGHDVAVFCHCTQSGAFDGVDYRDLAAFPAWCAGDRCDLFICSRYFEIFGAPIPATMKILWCHDMYGPDHFQRLEMFLPRINEVYCLSEFHRSHFIRHLPAWEPKIKKVHNGIDFSLVNEVSGGIEESHKVMYTSRPERGLLRALEIYERHGDPTLEFVACTYDYPWKQGGIDAIEQACKARIDDLCKRGFPVAMGSFSKRELYRHLTESKAVIYPAEVAEIMPISALEALACRTVYLAPDHSAFQEIVPYERIDLENTERWLEQLHNVLHNDSMRAELAEYGWRHVQFYSWAGVAKTFTSSDALNDLRILHTSKVKQADPKNLNGVGPLISCVMPTWDGVILAKEAIRCFIGQRYSNRELVIVAGGSERSQLAVSSYVSGLGRDDIRCICLRGEGATLGDMRNIGLDNARGEVICQWDDDGLYHPSRLEVQIGAMLDADASACFLTDHLQYFAMQQELFWIDRTVEGQNHGESAQFVPSLMIDKNAGFRYVEHGDEEFATIGDERRDSITEQLKTVNLSQYGYVYICRSHPRSTLPEKYHRKINDYAAPVDYMAQRCSDLLRALSEYRLPTPISVKARDGREVINYRV